MDKKKFNESAVHPLQTWEWGEFRKQWGNEVIRGEYGQIVFTHLPGGYKIGTILRGPTPNKKTLNLIKKVARENNAIFVKLEPKTVLRIEDKINSEGKRSVELLKDHGAVSGKTLFTPSSFWIDLAKPSDELLADFKRKTRYNVRYAKRKGVEVTIDNSDKAFEEYLKLMRETVERQGFYAHTEKYHRLMWKHLNVKRKANNEKPIANLMLAKHKKDVLAAWILFSWKDFLYYPYGASSNKKQNLQASSAMMWHAIKFGKQQGHKTFDLWGREEGEGFTRFKEGFSPKVVEFIGSWDMPTSPLYWFYRPAENIRWRILRLRSKFTKPDF